MTQLDLPPISIARYLDLLKRRRWQVLPISILGLLIGATVAFFIPRYYVATTVLQFNGTLLETGGGDDPMAPIVSAAEITIPFTVEQVFDEKGWWETDDEAERKAIADGVRERLEIIDKGRAQRARTTAFLQISYQDTDGVRAMDLVNTLRRIWVTNQRQALSQRIDAELDDINDRLAQTAEEMRALDTEIATFERQHDIDPLDRKLSVQYQTSSNVIGTLNQARLAIEGVKSERDALAEQLAIKKEELSLTSPTKVVVIEESVSPVVTEKLLTARLRVEQARKALENVSPNHRNRRRYEREFEAAKEALVELQKLVGVNQPREVENPEFQELRKKVADLTDQLAAAERRVQEAEARYKVLEESSLERPLIYRDYFELVSRRESIEARQEALQVDLRQMEARKRGLNFDKAYKLVSPPTVPLAPTEPNGILVALAGSAVGLAFAIGLVLLLDLAQSTFKTVDDVERLLGLPVLGGLSHMITTEDRRRARARRVRVSFAAGVFLLLVMTLFTIYYVDPASLPPMVRDALDLLLRDPGPTTG